MQTFIVETPAGPQTSFMPPPAPPPPATFSLELQTASVQKFVPSYQPQLFAPTLPTKSKPTPKPTSPANLGPLFAKE